MRSVPERPVLVTFGVLVGSFAAGPLLGLQLGATCAPDSDLGQVASVFAFPLAFFAGLLFWLGLGVLTVIVGALGNLLRGRIPSAASLDASEALVPPGYASFVVFSVVLAATAGIIVGLLSSIAVVSALAVYAICGAAYGLLLWLLAHHGYLPFPEPG